LRRGRNAGKVQSIWFFRHTRKGGNEKGPMPIEGKKGGKDAATEKKNITERHEKTEKNNTII